MNVRLIKMTEEQRFLLDNKINDVVIELDRKEWVYVSDVLKLWESQRDTREDLRGKSILKDYALHTKNISKAIRNKFKI